MAKITLNYDTTWLDITISVLDRETWTEEFTWTMTEIWTTGSYKYDFVEENKDYIYIASCLNHNDLKGSLIYSASSWLSPEQESQLQQVYDRVDMKVSNVWSGGWGYRWLDWQQVENILKRFFKDFKEDFEEQREQELQLILQEKELNSKLDRAKTEKSQEKILIQLESVKNELTTLKETNKLNKLTTKKGLDEILNKMKKEKVEIKEVKQVMEDNTELLQSLLDEAENNILKELLDTAEDDLLSELLEKAEKES